MTENASEPLNSVALPQQIIAHNETDEVTTSIASNTITTTMENLPGTSETLTNIRSDSISPGITTSVEAMSGSETISVSTQVNILSDHQPETTEFASQSMMETSTRHVMEDKTIVQDSEAISLPQNTITMGAEGPIVSTTPGELIEILPVSTLSTISSLPTINSNLPPWAARLRDCELIGDSYRGYVSNEVELDLILTLHKQHSNSCWGTRQSPSSAKPSIRLMWKSQYVPYDGIPFLNTGRRATVMECQYGPRRKGSTSKKSTDFDTQGNTLKKTHRPTCPARIYIKKVRKFPEYRIDPLLNLEGKNVRQAQERALTHLRLAGVEAGGEERFYVQLPLPIAHEYHDMEDLNLTASPDNRGQRLNQQVADKIHEFVARGLTGVYTIKHCLKEYVEKELCIGQDAPPRHNKAFFPTIIDLQNHIHEAQSALAAGQLLPLPPLNDPPIIPSPNKERVRKRKHPSKQSQTSQTIQRLQTAEAVASIQEIEQEHSSDVRDDDAKQENDHNLQEQLAQFTESDGQPLVITHGQADPTKNGQVVIVVTSNNVFTSQETDPPTTYALNSLPPSQITNISSSSFGTLPTGGQAVLIAQQGENGQFLAQTQSGNILTVMNSALQGIAPNQRVVLRMLANPSNLQHATTIDSQTENSAPEHLLASQAAVEAVLNAAATMDGTPGQQREEETDINDGEPAVKRQAVGIDLSSLVKEAGFDTHQVQVSGVDINTGESTTPHTTILTPTDAVTTEQLNSQDYTDNGTSLVEFTYQNTDDTKQTNQAVTIHVHGLETANSQETNRQQVEMDEVEAYDVLDSSQSTHLHHGTVDAREIHPISMETELIGNFPVSKFTNAAVTRESSVTMHVASEVSMLQSPTSSNNDGEVQEHINSSIVLVTDTRDVTRYQPNASTASNIDNNVGLHASQCVKELESTD